MRDHLTSKIIDETCGMFALLLKNLVFLGFRFPTLDNILEYLFNSPDLQKRFRIYFE